MLDSDNLQRSRIPMANHLKRERLDVAKYRYDSLPFSYLQLRSLTCIKVKIHDSSQKENQDSKD